MRRVLMTAFAAAALTTASLGLASPAFAANAPLNQQTGPDLDIHIHASHDAGWADVGNTVYGSTDVNSGHDVMFTGYSAFNLTTGADNTATETSISITGGSGFAQIADTDFVNAPPGKPIPTEDNLMYVLFDPAQTFYLYEFSLQNLNQGTISVYYTLASNPGVWILADGSFMNGSGDTQYIFGDKNDPSLAVDQVLIKSTTPIQQLKQNSIQYTGTIPSVPEPASWGLMLLGFAGVGVAMRRSRKRNPVLMQLA